MNKRIFVLFSLLLLLFFSVCACKKDENANTESENTSAIPATTHEKQIETGSEITTSSAPEETGPISFTDENGTTIYKVISGYRSGDKAKEAAKSVRRALKEALGTDVIIAEDWEKDLDLDEASQRYEILVGKTNRRESENEFASIEEGTYIIKITDRKIIILGYNEKGTQASADYFIEHYINNNEPLMKGTFIVNTFDEDPTETIPRDRSTGNLSPRIVNTKYPTDDIVIADIIVTNDGYAVDPTGKADSTAGIQKALDDCAKGKGGTVYLPEGRYVVSSSIKVPAFVTLRGDFNDPNLENGMGSGTVIDVWMSGNDDNKSGLFYLGGSGGIVGITVYYEKQSLGNVTPYPFTFYTTGDGDSYMLSTLKDIVVINGYRGIGACCLDERLPAHEQLTVENFKGTFLSCGAEVYNQADVGTWQDVKISADYWKNASEAYMKKPDSSKLDAYLKKNSIGLILGDLEWTEFAGLEINGYKTGINIVKGKRIEFAGSLYDTKITDCTNGIIVDSLDTRWGAVIAKSRIEGGIVNKTGGLVKLCGTTVIGAKEGSIEVSDLSLEKYEIDTKKSYNKPSTNLYIAKLPDDSGEKDCASSLISILEEAGKTGGIVYIPGGYYRFDKRITVPEGVELRGTSSVATRDQGSNTNGTVLLCYYGVGKTYDETSYAFITLSGKNSGINGIRIYYPDNSPTKERINTSYTVRSEGSGNYIVNSSIAGSAYGVDFSSCDEHFIKKVTTCCYYNTFLLGGKNGVLSGCLQNGTVLVRTNLDMIIDKIPDTDAFDLLFDPILRKQSKYIIVKGAENEIVFNTFCYGCANFVTNEDSVNTLCVNIGSDNIGSKTAQIVMNSGSMTIINSMRYNGHSFDHNSGKLNLYNRITINDKSEQTYEK